jgi:hypothetical protein
MIRISQEVERKVKQWRWRRQCYQCGMTAWELAVRVITLSRITSPKRESVGQLGATLIPSVVRSMPVKRLSCYWANIVVLETKAHLLPQRTVCDRQEKSMKLVT